MNFSLLCKWWWKIENEDGLWQSLIRKKFLHNNSIAFVKHHVNDSPCWHDLIKVKDLYMLGSKILVNNGNIARFWEDKWLYERSLALMYPDLYSICNDKNLVVKDCRDRHWDLSFRRWLSSDQIRNWNLIKQKADEFDFKNLMDKVQWGLTGNGLFSVSSLYQLMFAGL